MAKPTEKDRVQADQKQAKRADDVYTEWEDLYACELLEEYYYGRQHRDDSERRKYVINLFFPSIDISKPSLLFQLPKYKVTPRPTRIDDPLSDVEARAKLQEETLNSFVQSPDLGFALETGLGLLDAQFRFGMVQVGYTADFIDNPDAGKPVLTDQLDESGNPRAMVDTDGNEVQQQKVFLKSEGLFLKWISAKQFRASANSKNKTSANDWVGYYEWLYADDIKANPRYSTAAKKELQATGRLKGHNDNATEDDKKPGMVKTWFKWDLRSMTRRIWAEGAEKYLLDEPFQFLPLVGLKFNEILGQWLPMPVTYNWVHPQDQLNDIREKRRIHRSRADRRYRRRPNVTAEEFAKLSEGDMACIETNSPDDITPIPDAPLDPAIFRDEQTLLEDFTRTSGISGESQQVAQSETATQANLIALMGQTRENSKRMEVGKWLSAIGRVMLQTLRENMALPFWIKRAVDPNSPLAAQEALEVAKLWQQIEKEELGDIDMDISVDLASMSPVQQAQERTDWITFLGLVTNPSLGMVLSQSPALMRKTAGLFNITSERDLAEVSKSLQIAAMMMVQAQAAKAGVSMPGAPSPGQTPTNAAIGGQLAQQLPVESIQ